MVKNTKYVFIQSLVASVLLFLSFIVVEHFFDSLVVASIGATVFIMFVSPNSQRNSFKQLLGSYLIGSIIGIIFGYMNLAVNLTNVTILGVHSYIFFCALSTFFTMIILIYLKLQNPAALAIAILITFNSSPAKLAAVNFVLMCVVFLTQMLLRKYLKKL